jgi:xanthine dehydrogenase YagR molybdenum-binding subunit
MPAPPKTKKVKSVITVAGQEKEVEVEVPDVEASWGTPKDRKAVGSRMPRRDGWDKVTGRAKYTYDVNLPGLLHGAILRSPHAKARIKSIDLTPAERYPGVKAVLAIKKVGDVVRYAGDEVAALAAESPEAAEDAKRAIRVEYEPLPFVVKESDARDPEAPKVLGGDRANVEPGRLNERGDVAKAFAGAAAMVEGEYYAQARVHACLETHGHVVAYNPDGSLKVWASTQAVHPTADEFAEIAGLPKEKIEVVCEHMGGGFGSKFGPGVEGRTAAQLAKMAGAPVKLMLDRRGEAEAAGNAPSAGFAVKIAANADGTLAAVEAKGYGTGGIGGAGVPFPYLYQVPNQKVSQDTVRTNIGPSNAMRAPGHPQASFLMESAVDELAYKLGMDPLQFRMKNDPFPIRQTEYKIGAERIGWAQKFNKTPGKGNGPVLTGVGVAAATWGGGGGAGSQVDVLIGRDGSVVVQLGTQDLGTGTRTYMPAIVADELGLPVEAVKSAIGNSKYGYSGGSGGSTTTPSVAPAVKMAAIQARFDVLQAVAKATNTPLEKMDLAGGAVVAGDKKLAWKDACKLLPAEGLKSHGVWVPELRQSGIGGVQFAEVAVDVETGRVRVKKLVAVHDCGVVMNRMTLESQINGGIIQGLGFALLEDRLVDAQTGRMVNPNLEEYKLPGPWEMPEFDVYIYEDPNAKGVSGMAESPVIPTAAAIANAVYNASGARVRELPIVPARVLAGLGKVQGGKLA